MSSAHPALTPKASLDSLRKQAKRWKRQIDQGDPDAIARFGAGKTSSLRQVQQALARDYGFKSWADLKQELEDRARSRADILELFLAKGVNRYGSDPRHGRWGGYEPDSPQRGSLAARLLARHPDLAKDSIDAAVLAHDLEAVRSFLERSPSLANQRSDFDGWPPLARLAYARLPLNAGAGDPLAIAGLVLAAGADPRAPLPGALSGFTALAGVIGGGEGAQSSHPEALALARLLVDHGADPLDGQALYNTSLGEDDITWLERLWSWSEEKGETARWREPAPQLIGLPLDYLLGNATPKHPRRMAWLLAHGANPAARNPYSMQPVIKHAQLGGGGEALDLLVAHGARPVVLSEAEELVAAAIRGERKAVQMRAAANPALLNDPSALFAAAHSNDFAMTGLLLDLGMSPDLAGRHNLRALHLAADAEAVEMARVLIERGAEIDPIETQYNSTPLGHAHFHGREGMIGLLAPLSHDIRGLCFCAALVRLTELLTIEPDLAKAPSRGSAPLFALPADDAKAMEVAELLLSFGADPAVRDAEGLTPGQAAFRRGLEETAALLTP